MAAFSSDIPARGGTARGSAGPVRLLLPGAAQASRRRATPWLVAIVLIIAALGVWTSAGLAQDDDSTRTARSAMAKSLDPIKGRFHRVHGMTLKLNCGTCHGTDGPDALVERKPDGAAADTPGRVDRWACIGCHKASAKPVWSSRPER